MRSNFGLNFAAYRNSLGLTQNEMAEKLEVTQTTISSWETRGKEPRSKKDFVEKMHRLFGTTEADLYGLSDGFYARSTGITQPFIKPMPSDTYAPVIGNIAAGDPREAIEQSDEVHWVPPDVISQYPDGFFLVIVGDSMDRVLPEGSYAFVAPIEVHTGDIAAVKVNGDDACVKRVVMSSEMNAVKLVPESSNPVWKPRIIDQDDPDAPMVRMLGKVVWASIEF